MSEIGELVTPTGRLVLPADQLGGEQWLQDRRWRHPADIPGWEFRKVDHWSELPEGYRIGSSEVPSILDLPEVDTPAHVYRTKVYDIRTPKNEAMDWGHIFEGPIALEWCRRNRAVIDEIGLVARDDAPWHQSTIDRRVRRCPVYPELSAENAICGLEVKNVGRASAARWHREIPDRILAQMIHQLYVTGYHHMHYACNIGGNTMRQGIVYAEREQKLMRFVVAAVDRFRAEHLLAGVEPPWSEDKPDKMIALDNATHPERGGVIELDVHGIGDVMEYAEVAAQAGAIDKRKKRIAARLRQRANGAEIATFSGERAFWYGDGHRPNVDLDKLKEGWPDAYEACVREKGFPVLHIDAAYKARGDEG